MARTQLRRKVNAPPKTGRPSKHLQAPKRRKQGNAKYLCPHCNKFVSRSTLWRHSKGKRIAGIAQSAWQTFQSKVLSPMNLSPASRHSAQFAPATSTPRSISSRVFGRLASLMPGRTSLDRNSNSSQALPSVSVAESAPNTMAASADATLDFNNNDGFADGGPPTSPRVEEWASNHRRATVEDADDDDYFGMHSEHSHSSSDSDTDGGGGEGPEGWENDWEDNWEVDDFMQAELERQINELGECLS